MGDFGAQSLFCSCTSYSCAKEWRLFTSAERRSWWLKEQEATSSLPAPFCGKEMTICRVSLKKLFSSLANFATCWWVNVKQSPGKCREREQQSSPGCGVDKSRLASREGAGRAVDHKGWARPSAPAARRAAPELPDRALPYEPALQSIPVFTVECTKCLPQLFSWFVSLVKCRVYHSFPEECALPTSSWKILSGSASWGAQAPWRLAESVQLISLLDSWYV